jgi:hypothetical protein
METGLQSNPRATTIERNPLRAAECKECGPKVNPTSGLQAHLMRRRLRWHRFETELRKLYDTFCT